MIKEILHIVLIISLLFSYSSRKLNAQMRVIPDQSISNVYKKYFKITERSQGKVLDQKSSGTGIGNVFCNSTYYSVTNQQWMILPSFPGSQEFMIVSRKDGKRLRRQAPYSNYYCSYVPHDNIYFLESVSDGYYAINEKNTSYYMDRYHTDNLYAASFAHYGANQQFKFTEVGTIPNSNNLNVYSDENGIHLPEAPISLSDPGNTSKQCRTLKGRTVIPFPLISDPGKTDSWKAQYSCYYILERYEYYYLDDIMPIGYGIGHEWSSTDELGYSYTEFNQTKTILGLELNIGGKIFPTSIPSITGNLKGNWSKEQTTSISETNSYNSTRVDKYSKMIIDAQLTFKYLLKEEYFLRRLDGSLVDDWTLTLDRTPVLMSYPDAAYVTSTQKSGGDLIFIQQIRENLIPRMYSNSLYSGKASAS